jgi:hypothetical protein
MPAETLRTWTVKAQKAPEAEPLSAESSAKGNDEGTMLRREVLGLRERNEILLQTISLYARELDRLR